MNEKIFSVILLIAVVFSVFFNTKILTDKIDKIIEETESLNLDDEIQIAGENAKKIYEKYKSAETFMSLTVSHDDLTNIEDCFVEMIASLDVSDVDGAKIAKSRLINSLEHLRRLCGFNIDSII